MKPAPFDYCAPERVEDALEYLSDGDAMILAGGQTLMPLLALRLSTPARLIDINRIDALKGVSRIDGGTRIAAVTRQYEILADHTLARTLPALIEATRHVGHYQTRNRGTIGGSIALGESAAELPATAVALGATIEAHSKRGIRRISADSFYVGTYSTLLEPDELIAAIHFPDWPAGSLTLFREVARRPGDFALVGLIGSLAVEQGRITRAGIAWFGIGPTPMKAKQAEAALIGQDLRRIDAKAIAELAIADSEPYDDLHATADYRRRVGLRVFERCLSEAVNARPI
jgi:carbon-monoxide dehydrogenase medium subunit